MDASRQKTRTRYSSKKSTSPLVVEGTQYAAFPLKLLGSPIWLLLSHAERSLYIELRANWHKQTHAHWESPFWAPYAQMNAAPGTISKAIRRFKEFGLIEVAQEEQGGLLGYATKFLMSRKWESYQPTEAEERKSFARSQARLKKRKRDRDRLIQHQRGLRLIQSQLHSLDTLTPPTGGSTPPEPQKPISPSGAEEEAENAK